MWVPEITISGWCSASPLASRTSASIARLRLPPRASVVAQKGAVLIATVLNAQHRAQPSSDVR